MIESTSTTNTGGVAQLQVLSLPCGSSCVLCEGGLCLKDGTPYYSDQLLIWYLVISQQPDLTELSHLSLWLSEWETATAWIAVTVPNLRRAIVSGRDSRYPSVAANQAQQVLRLI